jgi:hypothetical protein
MKHQHKPKIGDNIVALAKNALVPHNGGQRNDVHPTLFYKLITFNLKKLSTYNDESIIT